MSDKIETTQSGLDEMKKEVEVRKEKLKDIADKIDEARQQGDLSENAAYTTALADKELNQTRIRELREKISKSVVVSSDRRNNKVDLGENVRVKRLSDGKVIDYEMVGINESDPSLNKISVNSPIGRALVGKKTGDKVKVELPSGLEEFKIEEIF
ncbi:MAG TPA: transcription elongation factor GreA [bacterium]|nr:transcription elongation factor GreA [bacterium]